MRMNRLVVAVMGCVLAACSTPGDTTKAVHLSGAQLLLPLDADASTASLEVARRLPGSPLAPVSAPYQVSVPGGQRSGAVTLRLPIDLARVAALHQTPSDVRITKRTLDGRGSLEIPTRLDPTGRFAEADISSSALYEAGLPVSTSCLVTEDCSQQCDVQAGKFPNSPSTTHSLAHQVCTDIEAANYSQAIADAKSLLQVLDSNLASGTITPEAFEDLSSAAISLELLLSRIPVVDVTTTWVGQLPLGDDVRPILVQLHQRRDGSVSGYLLGGTAVAFISGGWVGVDQLHLVLQYRNSPSYRVFAFDGTVSTVSENDHLVPVSFDAVADDGVNKVPVVWAPTTNSLVEKRFVFHGNGDIDLAVVFSQPEGGSPSFVGGSFVSSNCDLVGCDGEIFSFNEDASTHDLILSFRTIDGPAGTISATYNSTTNMYSASWAAQPGDRSGSMDGFRTTGTTSADAALVLANFGRLADDLVFPGADSVFEVTSYDPIAASYDHFGSGSTALLSRLDNEVSIRHPFLVSFDNFRNMKTDASDPLVLDKVLPSVDYRDLRIALDSSIPVTYRDDDDLPPSDELRFFNVDGGAIKFGGNQSDSLTFGLPFAMTDFESLWHVGGFLPFGVQRAWMMSSSSEQFRFNFTAASCSTSGPTIKAIADANMWFFHQTAPSANTSSYFELCTGIPGDQDHAPAYRVQYDGVVLPDGQGVPSAVEGGMGIGTAACSANGPQPFYFWTGVKTSTDFLRPFCPYWLYGPENRAMLLQGRNSTPYQEELTEPFLCNEEPDGSHPFPRVLTWELQAGSTTSNNFHAIRFSHGAPQEPNPLKGKKKCACALRASLNK